MDINLFIFFTILAFICLFLAKVGRSSGLSFGLGIVSTLIFVLLGLLIGDTANEITVVLVVNNTVETVPLALGITNDNTAIIFFILAILSIFIGVD